MMRRIDFAKYQEKQDDSFAGGVLSPDLVTMISSKEKLKTVVNLISEHHTVYWVSDGAWSMHELLMATLSKVGPAEVYISSYAMGETPARILARLKNEGVIKKLFCVLDNRVDVRTAGSLQLIKSISDKCALIDTHAKVTLLDSGDKKVVIVGSANYTENERYEAGVISCCNSTFELHQKWILNELN